MTEPVGPLVRRAQAGNTLAMADLLDRVTPYVSRVCGAIALSSGPDAAQETLIAVFRGLRRLSEPDTFFGWVRAIAVREAVRAAGRDRRATPSDRARTGGGGAGGDGGAGPAGGRALRTVPENRLRAPPPSRLPSP